MPLLPSHSFSQCSVQIVDRKLAWSSRPRIDHVNDEYLEYKQRERAMREQSFHTRAQVETWRDLSETTAPSSRVSPKNDDHAQRNLNSIIIIPNSSSTKNDRRPLDYPYAALFDHERKRFIFVLFQPIEDHKLQWQKKARVNQHNNDYIERIRQKRSVPLVKLARHLSDQHFSRSDLSREDRMDNEDSACRRS